MTQIDEVEREEETPVTGSDYLTIYGKDQTRGEYNVKTGEATKQRRLSEGRKLRERRLREMINLKEKEIITKVASNKVSKLELHTSREMDEYMKDDAEWTNSRGREMSGLWQGGIS